MKKCDCRLSMIDLRYLLPLFVKKSITGVKLSPDQCYELARFLSDNEDKFLKREKKKHKIVINVRGGVVQSVHGTKGIQAVLIDEDALTDEPITQEQINANFNEEIDGLSELPIK
jgi:hypothetical protein